MREDRLEVLYMSIDYFKFHSGAAGPPEAWCLRRNVLGAIAPVKCQPAYSEIMGGVNMEIDLLNLATLVVVGTLSVAGYLTQVGGILKTPLMLSGV